MSQLKVNLTELAAGGIALGADSLIVQCPNCGYEVTLEPGATFTPCGDEQPGAPTADQASIDAQVDAQPGGAGSGSLVPAHPLPEPASCTLDNGGQCELCLDAITRPTGDAETNRETPLPGLADK